MNDLRLAEAVEYLAKDDPQARTSEYLHILRREWASGGTYEGAQFKPHPSLDAIMVRARNRRLDTLIASCTTNQYSVLLINTKGGRE